MPDHEIHSPVAVDITRQHTPSSVQGRQFSDSRETTVRCLLKNLNGGRLVGHGRTGDVQPTVAIEVTDSHSPDALALACTQVARRRESAVRLLEKDGDIRRCDLTPDRHDQILATVAVDITYRHIEARDFTKAWRLIQEQLPIGLLKPDKGLVPVVLNSHEIETSIAVDVGNPKHLNQFVDELAWLQATCNSLSKHKHAAVPAAHGNVGTSVTCQIANGHGRDGAAPVVAGLKVGGKVQSDRRIQLTVRPTSAEIDRIRIAIVALV